MKLTLTTFNCENLFNRYAFLDQPLADKNYEKFIMASTVASVAKAECFHTETPFPTIEGDHTEASDHCPVSVMLEV